MPTREEIQPKVKSLLGEFLPAEDLSELTDETPLITGGILDSIATLRLVGLIEEKFGVELDAREADSEHLDTISLITDLVLSKL